MEEIGDKKKNNNDNINDNNKDYDEEDDQNVPIDTSGNVLFTMQS